MVKGLTTQTQSGVSVQDSRNYQYRSGSIESLHRLTTSVERRPLSEVTDESPRLASSVVSVRAQVVQTSSSLSVGHASPLAPLRQQDSQALGELFEAEHIQEITLDVHRYLARMYPEPCWEDEPYEFLHGYV
ncbi:MAG: hypothetical protein AAGH78_05860 [Cyanobacteria bacterium P01_H01_bin.58]